MELFTIIMALASFLLSSLLIIPKFRERLLAITNKTSESKNSISNHKKGKIIKLQEVVALLNHPAISNHYLIIEKYHSDYSVIIQKQHSTDELAFEAAGITNYRKQKIVDLEQQLQKFKDENNHLKKELSMFKLNSEPVQEEYLYQPSILEQDSITTEEKTTNEYGHLSDRLYHLIKN